MDAPLSLLILAKDLSPKKFEFDLPDAASLAHFCRRQRCQGADPRNEESLPCYVAGSGERFRSIPATHWCMPMTCILHVSSAAAHGHADRRYMLQKLLRSSANDDHYYLKPRILAYSNASRSTDSACSGLMYNTFFPATNLLVRVPRTTAEP